MIPVPLLLAGAELLKTVMTGDEKEDEKKVIEVIGEAAKLIKEKPFYLSKRFIAAAVTTILLMLNKKLGLNLGIEEITAITGLVSVYVASKSYEQRP